MKKGRYALNNEGVITWCSANEENLGKGRCNHLEHQKINETVTDFINRINIQSKPELENRIMNSHANFESYEDLVLNYPTQCKSASIRFNNYYNHVKNMEWKISYMTTFELKYLDKDTRGEYFNKIHNLEVKRVQLHDYCLKEVEVLNELTKKLKIKPFIKGNCTSANRDHVAEALFDFCKIQEVEIEYYY